MLGIFRQHRLIRQTAAKIDSLPLERAYEVQDSYIAARLSAGERVVGWKIGCTSRAIQEQFGLTQPICGRLLAPHIYTDGTEFAVGEFIDCAVEPEVVFHIGRDLSEDMGATDLRKSIDAGLVCRECPSVAAGGRDRVSPASRTSRRVGPSVFGANAEDVFEALRIGEALFCISLVSAPRSTECFQLLGSWIHR